jgi:phosphoglucosamine mutase
MSRLFGTDGVRGVAGEELTGQLAMDLAAAAAGLLQDARTGTAQSNGTRLVAVVGRDPRTSGEFLEAAVVAGLAGAGVDVLRLGVIPTPGVAHLTAELGADLGVMLSASHNPAADNGIKLFARGGFKLPDAAEDEIEARLADPGRIRPGQPAGGFGRVRDARGERERYLAHLLASQPGGAGGKAYEAAAAWGPDDAAARGVAEAMGGGTAAARHAGTTAARHAGAEAGTAAEGTRAGEAGRTTPAGAAASRPAGWNGGAAERGAAPLAGMRVVVDCAHGAASELAPVLLRRAGADVIAIGAEPDGENINAGCGSTHLETLSAAVVKHGADAGIAHDGDADRCLAVDAAGQVIDGDQILAVLALGLKAQNRLAGNTVVATVMSNLGFRLAMAEAGITVIETGVGDRYVLEAMRAGSFVLGGEQSGHIIMLDHATTGDGLLTALHLLATAAGQGATLADLGRVMTRYPQVLVNVTGVDKARAARSPELATAVAAAEAELGSSGRVLVRPSGTEPTVRVMVEAKDHAHANRVADTLAATVRAVSLPSPSPRPNSAPPRPRPPPAPATPFHDPFGCSPSRGPKSERIPIVHSGAFRFSTEGPISARCPQGSGGRWRGN